uniref:Mitochondrial ribosomal protein L12 n=1 Tax=Anas platyrhynchos platyrhynchos TaxID=8840 RepID=A0A493U0C6_ANAPP
ALAGAPLDTAAKRYSPKVQQLVRDIAGLTLLEVADLNALLKETLKISDVGVMPVGAAAALVPPPAAPQEEEEVPRKKEKMVFSVRLTELKAADKVKLIKEVKNFSHTLPPHRQRSWWSPYHRRSRRTRPRRKRRRSKRRWRQQEGLWFWSRGPRLTAGGLAYQQHRRCPAGTAH